LCTPLLNASSGSIATTNDVAGTPYETDPYPVDSFESSLGASRVAGNVFRDLLTFPWVG
jgi:hypothetical protein